jgi:hypothetical protein
VNTYTNTVGETVTAPMTPEYSRPTDVGGSRKQRRYGKELLESPALSGEVKAEWEDVSSQAPLHDGPVFSREMTPEWEEVHSQAPLVDDPVFSTEVTPEHEGGEMLGSEVISIEVEPQHEGESQSGWSGREASPDAEHGQQSGWSSREVSPEHAWLHPSLPSSTEMTAEYYTPQAADPDFDYIPLHEKRPAVSEHDRNHAETDDWNITVSSEDVEPPVYTKVTTSDDTAIYRQPPYQTDLSDEVGTIGNPESDHLDGFRVCCNPTEGGPPPCAEVHMVFEVSPDNKPHAKSWLGLPTMCLYEDTSRAETLALRIE